MRSSFYKIGYQLAFAGGLAVRAPDLIAAGKQVFLDLKLHDIGNTVRRASRAWRKLGATFLTVHAYPQTMKAAVAGQARLEACAFSPSPCSPPTTMPISPPPATT